MSSMDSVEGPPETSELKPPWPQTWVFLTLGFHCICLFVTWKSSINTYDFCRTILYNNLLTLYLASASYKKTALFLLYFNHFVLSCSPLIWLACSPVQGHEVIKQRTGSS